MLAPAGPPTNKTLGTALVYTKGNRLDSGAARIWLKGRAKIFSVIIGKKHKNYNKNFIKII